MPKLTKSQIRRQNNQLIDQFNLEPDENKRMRILEKIGWE